MDKFTKASAAANDNGLVWYNEIDPYAAQWLRNLIDAGHIAPGVVDERSILDVRPADLVGYVQCHFFAGIGVWSAALRASGWPDARRIWTASCPCQPFSTAGKGGGFDDERHLWPALQWLVQQCRPDVVIGEQVASKDGLGWLDLVSTDMEAMGYTFGAVPFPAAGVGAPHRRERLYWVADATEQGRRTQSERPTGAHWRTTQEPGRLRDAGVAQGDAFCEGLEGRNAGAVGIECAAVERAGEAGELGNTEHRGREGRVAAWPWSGAAMPPSQTNGFWSEADWIWCRDGKARPTKPGIHPLAHGATARVGRLRAYGNAIVKQQAQAFIEAYLGVADNDNQPLQAAA